MYKTHAKPLKKSAHIAITTTTPGCEGFFFKKTARGTILNSGIARKSLAIRDKRRIFTMPSDPQMKLSSSKFGNSKGALVEKKMNPQVLRKNTQVLKILTKMSGWWFRPS